MSDRAIQSETISRAELLQRAALAGAAIALAGGATNACSAGEVPLVQDMKLTALDAAVQELQKLRAAPAVQLGGDWSVRKVMLHCAQSIDLSIDGFPQMKSGLFRATIGRIARSKFLSDGKMSHNLTDAIPGAPEFANAGDWKDGIDVLLTAIRRFQAHNGVMQPHFAYGETNKSEYEQLHAMHIANHLSAMQYS
ncbi:MAG: DUF1569 domain-containing protein [Leptospirales bacterium]|nr:DUF1569 domain-containing protein [Leptospirales bacterium]